MAPRDPFEYFRVEARELLDHLNAGVLSLEKGERPREAVAALLRHAHTLKGAARVVRLAEMADKVHRLEGLLAPFRDGAQAPPRAVADALLALLDQLGAHLEALDGPAAGPAVPAAAPPAAAPRPAPERRLDTVRLEVGELDALMEGLREAASRIEVLRNEGPGLERARRLSQGLAAAAAAEPRTRAMAQELESWLERFQRRALPGLEQAERELVEAHGKAGRLRMLPAAALFGALERTCRDAAAETGKAVRFEAAGGEERLDAPVFTALHEALQHAVRNAVVHGIEDPAGRRARGKPAEGVVRVALERRAGQARISCSDDGGGIDIGAVRRAAAERGLLEPGAPDPLDLDRAVALLLAGGLSTASKVTELSGRGLGLDALRATVAGLKGRMSLRSVPGQGLELELLVPQSLANLQALAVEAGGRTALLPFKSVAAALGLGAAAREGERSILVRGEPLPLLCLDACLGPPAGAPKRGAGVLLRTGSGKAVLAVDRILGVRDAVVLPLPDLMPGLGLAAGASLDAGGALCLVLDPEGLVRAAGAGGAAAPAPPAAKAGLPPLLVIDDSLTTRRLEQSILETAGYPVDTANSAEEGLAKVRERRYGLILVDVEMPGMDGFGFVERLRADADSRGIPAILVSSRNSAEDLRRGREAGASDYMAKGEFDQARLLGRIRELLA